jgi:4-hydroxybutyrate CoA-transferase
MNDWRDEYSQKITSKEKAISNILSENRVVFGHAAGEPIVLVDELVRQKDRLQNVEIVHMVPLRECEYCLPAMKNHFHHNSLFFRNSTPF